MTNAMHYYQTVPDVVFISGGMSGIGAQLAKAYAQAGANIGIFDVQENPDTLARIKDRMTSSQQQIQTFQIDICQHQDVEQAINNAVATLGAPNLAINCAGILRSAPFEKLDYETFKQVVDVNLMGSRNFAASVIPHFAPGSHLVLMASLAGIVGTYTHAAYAASKFGVVGLAEVLKLELKTQNIDVSVICPGEITTPLLEHERQYGSKVTTKMNKFAGVLDVHTACNGMLKGLANRQFMITPGFKAWFTREFAKKASTLFRKIADYKYSQARNSV